MMFGLFLVVFSIFANCNSLDLLSLDDISNPGEDSPGTVYKAGQPGANWTPEEIDSTRQRILQAITPIWPEKIGKKIITGIPRFLRFRFPRFRFPQFRFPRFLIYRGL